MMYTLIVFGNKRYTGRYVKYKGKEFLIGTKELLNDLLPDDSSGFVNTEAENLYDDISFFLDKYKLYLKESEIIDILKEYNII